MHTNNCDRVWSLMAKMLAKEATEDELEELEQLIRVDPQLNFSKETLLDFWSPEISSDFSYAENKYQQLILQLKKLGVDDGKLGDNEHYIDNNINDDQLNRIRKSKTNKKLLVISSVLVLLISVAFFFKSQLAYNDKKKAVAHQANNEISTKKGSKTDLLLPDGTKVWLNSNSKITFDREYGTKLREVVLSGEAYFEVVKNASKPFVIHTPKMDIKVLGTAFNVKCYPDEKTTETSLVRGSIEITLKDRPEKIMLRPNEKLIINNYEIVLNKAAGKNVLKSDKLKHDPIISLSHLTLYPRDSTVIETAWIQNKFVFSSETFEEIALKMERWYNVKIEFADEYLKNERLTGNFEKETITEALAAMQFTTPFSFNIKNDRIIIRKK